jgi:DNA repair exonuclease SbcCD ATPase subunit
MKSNEKENLRKKLLQKSKALNDFIILSIIAILVFIVATIFGLHHRIDQWVINHEGKIFKFDEILVVFSILAFCLFIFYLRRWKELRIEVNRRKNLEAQLFSKHEDLEDRVQKRTFELAKINVELQEQIDAHKKTLSEIETLGKQIEFILSVTKTGLDIIDSDYNIIYIDPAWQKVYGDYKGRKCYEYFMGRHERCPGCGVTKALETKEVEVTQEFLVKENNRPIEVTTIPFQDKDCNWLVAEVNVDISERKKIEAELHKYQDYFKIKRDNT